MSLFVKRFISIPRARFSTKYVDEYHSAYKESGSLRDRPIRVKLGWLKSFVVVLPFLYLGSVISRESAAYMEEYEIFVPTDDD